MKFENKELDKETLDRLADHGILLSKNCPRMNKEKALILIGEAMLDKFIKEFVSLWKNELFPDCLLKDHEVSEEEKQRILGNQDADEDGSSKLNGQDNNGFCEQEEHTPAGVDYGNGLTQIRNNLKVDQQLISDIYGSCDSRYQSTTKKTQKNRQQVPSGYGENYQVTRAKPYYVAESKLLKLVRRLWKVPEAYKKQRGGNSDGYRQTWFRSLESYLK